MNRIHAKRLLKLANFLRSLPTKSFDIGVWKEQRRCGTVACALGWACEIPAFNKAGLVYSNSLNVPVAYKKDSSEYSEGMKAAEAFFGLTPKEAMAIFHIDGYRKTENIYYEEVYFSKLQPKEVAEKIQKVVSSYFPLVNSQ